MLNQNTFGAYQPTDEERNEKEDNVLLSLLGNTAAASGLAAGAGFGIDTERRRRSKEGPTTLKDAAKESVSDLRSALKVLSGNSAYDQKIYNETDRYEEDDYKKAGDDNTYSYRDLRQFSTEPRALDFEDTKADRNLFISNTNSGYNSNPLTQAAIAARSAFTASSEDLLASERAYRESEGLSAEGPRSQTALSRIPALDGLRDLASSSNNPALRAFGYSPERMSFRQEHNVDLMKANRPQQIGSALGRAGADFVNNGARSLWWLVNAPQAVADLVSEGTAGEANRFGLYGVDLKNYDDAVQSGWVDPETVESKGGMVSEKTNYRYSKDPYLRKKYAELTDDLKPIDGERYIDRKREKIFGKRRINNNLSTLLAFPAAVGINAGLGLVNPIGGSDGYKAVLPSEEDPTVTRNAILEVGSKYILGRRGDILPWEEFKKVRPDVSKDDYMAYKAYKYSKGMDLNPLDGDWNLLGGILKGTDDGIEGGEVMFLGKHMPTDTVLMPTLAAALGTAAGASLAKHGALNPYGVREKIERIEAQINAMPKDKESFDQKKYNKLNKKKNKANARLERMDNILQSIPGLNKNNLDRLVYRRNPITAGLLLGGATYAATSAVGHMNENNRRQQKIVENNQREFYSPNGI